MEDLRAKGRPCAGETSAAASRTRIIAQRAARRRQACEQMVLTTLDLDRRDRESELLALARLHAVSMLDASFLRADGDAAHEGGRLARSPERALVPRIAREWTAPQSSARAGGEEWLGETERERVRSVRERVRMASQGDGDARTEQGATRVREPPRLRGRQVRADVVTRMAMERQRELQGLSEHSAVSAFAHRGRIQSFLRGRFFRSGRPMHDERQFSMATRELGQLRQSRPVSRLREEVRSRTESITNDQATDHSGLMGTQNSSANNEHHSFIDQVLHEDNHHLENATHNHEIQTPQSMEDEYVDIETNVPNSNEVLPNNFGQEQIHRYEEYSDAGSSEQDVEQSGSSSSSPSDNSARQEAETYGQQTDLQWSTEISSSEDGEDGLFLHRDEEWHVLDSQEAEPRWQSGQSFSSIRNINWFSPPDDDVYGVELRELLSRRRVSNLLSSGFHGSLDQLIQSYVRRQEHDPQDWDYERPRPTTGSLNEDRVERMINEPNQAERDTTPQPSVVLPDQAFFPQQRHWQIELPHHNWSQQTMHRTEFDWDAIHVLRDDLTGLQRGMTNMQRMLEACMEMQIELQRSIKQEVSAALNCSLTVGKTAEGMLEDGSQWKLARKGTCCFCCDNQIDSLLYRCGHMCTCSKCASELLHGVGKCPLCRAPIVEVIRAYCIM